MTKKSAPSGKKPRAAALKPIYTRKKPDLKVQCIYLYYVTESSDPAQRIRAYFIDMKADIARNNVVSYVEDILKGIDATPPTRYPCGWAFADVVWRRKSYLVVVYDERGAKLDPDNAVEIFDRAKGAMHPFRDGGNTGLSKGRSGFYCLNHMTEKGGDTDLSPGWDEPFTLTVNHFHARARGPLKILNHNDSGTNMGPPISP